VTLRQRFPALFNFAAFFNEDWMEDAPTWKLLIDFVTEHTATSERRAFVEELNALLDDRDLQLDEAAMELGFMYWPEPQTYREWLEDVRDRLAASLDSDGDTAL
jgi:hypothetical protein